jgi:hypothetical protein
MRVCEQETPKRGNLQVTERVIERKAKRLFRAKIAAFEGEVEQ